VSLFTANDSHGQWVYFESEREFERRPGQLGEERSFIKGWLWRRFASLPFQAIAISATTKDADGKGADSFLPIGVVRDADHRFWLGSLNSYGHSALVVLDVSRRGAQQIVSVEYPGC
jgi:hypothetical protein